MTTLRRECRLSVYLGNADIHHHQVVSGGIVRRAEQAGLREAASRQGIAVFGRSRRLHTGAGVVASGDGVGE